MKRDLFTSIPIYILYFFRISNNVKILLKYKCASHRHTHPKTNISFHTSFFKKFSFHSLTRIFSLFHNSTKKSYSFRSPSWLQLFWQYNTISINPYPLYTIKSLGYFKRLKTTIKHLLLPLPHRKSYSIKNTLCMWRNTTHATKKLLYK